MGFFFSSYINVISYSRYIDKIMPVKEVSTGGLKQELERAGDKLVLVDFFATWYIFIHSLSYSSSFYS
jgi:hypothetical protein